MNGVTQWEAKEIIREKNARITALTAEVERLREGLSSIARNTCCDKCQEAAMVARAALAGKAEQ